MEKKKIKVSTLTGALLDYWAAKANDEAPYIKQYFDNSKQCWIESSDSPYSPSTDWSQGGPIIESENILFDALPDHGHRAYLRDKTGRPLCITDGWHTTKLIQAMRAFVSSKFGEEVDEL